MDQEGPKTRRKLRSDSVRNRQRLLEAATEIFSAGAAQASLEAVARKAEVGIGTLYRHFPTREALFEAVYRHEVDLLSELAERLERESCEPVDALKQWLHANVRLMATKKGMVEALQLAAMSNSDLKAYTYERMVSALDALMKRAVDAKAIKDELSGEDLLRTLVGIFYAQQHESWQQTASRVIDILIEGMRNR